MLDGLSSLFTVPQVMSLLFEYGQAASLATADEHGRDVAASTSSARQTEMTMLRPDAPT
ncbi:hypothetical protein [Bradyrhizobium genosp. SA-3]|uniref:hypothetical protein n=1 Tax=Bradyrhizobium genosp. SA-3 TaxID=508868 RepID=UPI003D9B6696